MGLKLKIHLNQLKDTLNKNIEDLSNKITLKLNLDIKYSYYIHLFILFLILIITIRIIYVLFFGYSGNKTGGGWKIRKVGRTLSRPSKF